QAVVNGDKVSEDPHHNEDQDQSHQNDDTHRLVSPLELEQPSVFCQEDAPADHGQNSATENTLSGATAQRASNFLLTSPGNKEGWLVRSLHDQIAVVFILGLRILHAGPRDVIPVLRNHQMLG